MPGKHNTINQIPSLPSRRRQTCEQKMTTQGHIHNGRGQPRGHGSPEKGAQGAQEITLLASCSLCTIEDTNSLWDLRDITLTLWPWFLFFTQQSIWAQCFPRSYPMILTFLYLLLFGWIDTMPVFIISLMFFKRVEAFSELQASWSLGQKFWHWEVVSETSRRVQTFFFFLSLSARYGQAYSGHTACLLAKSWGRLHLMTVVPGHGFAVVNKNRCSS